MTKVSDKNKATAQDLLARWKEEWSLEPMADPKHAGWRKLVDESLENHIATAISESRTAEWQPIETAPKEERILLSTVNGVGYGYWYREVEAEGGQCWRLDDPYMQRFDIVFDKQPTHWMPLPDPPESR